MMKIALFALGVLAFARGSELGWDGYPMCGGGPPPRNFCQGFAEIRTEFNGIETVHGRISKHEGEEAPKKTKLRYRVPGGRNARKIIEVQGNCCWKFYKG